VSTRLLERGEFPLIEEEAIAEGLLRVKESPTSPAIVDPAVLLLIEDES